MKKVLYIIGVFACLLTLLFPSCADEEFSINPIHVLSFSQDTVRFDTVFTTIGSATYQLRVYNSNKKPLKISSISLTDSPRSPFRINVDGHKGTYFADLEIQDKDSMYIFIEVNIDPQNRENPVFMRDSLIFVTNGVKQMVQLMAYGQDVLILRGKVIQTDTLLTSYRPLLIYDSLRVERSATLSLSEGTKLYFHGKSDLLVYGRIKATGSLQAPVVFRGDRMDYLFSDLPYDRVPGQWGGIRLFDESMENEFDYVDIHGGTFGIRCDSSDVSKKKLTLTNSIVHNVLGDGLRMINCSAQVANSQLSNAGGNCINLLGGNYEFTHCTVANYFSWSARGGVALSINNLSSKIDYPLYKVLFINCIIAGSSSDEISAQRSTNEEIPFICHFSNSLINSDEPDEEIHLGCIWERDNHFLYIGKTDYQYDLRPDSLSPALNIGLREVAEKYTTDLKGRSRLSDQAPDAGCYEWMEGDKSTFK